MTQYVVFVAMLMSISSIRRNGIENTFLNIWIPFFLAMPFVFWVNIPGLPDPNFMQAAIIPLMYALIRNNIEKIRIGTLEVLIILYITIRLFADFLGRGYSDAQNYGFYMLTSLVGPYMLGRYVITSRRMDIATSKAFVLMFLLFFPLFLYEAKFWVSPIFKILSPLFPGTGSGLSLRWGLARTAGTFEHPILACIMIISVYRLHRWLCWIGEWNGPQTGILGIIQRWSIFIPLRLDLKISLTLVLMALMTISRGPWIGGIAAAVLVLAGNARDRKRGLWIVAAGFVAAGIIGKIALDAYLTPEAGAVLSGEAQTMLYRKVMVERYQEFLLAKFWWGWGLTTVPKIHGMESIDNAFFLMALQHGIFAPTLFVIIFIYAIVTQLRFGLSSPPGRTPIGFTFSGIYMMCFIAFTTVYMGVQTEPLLFLLLGWGEGIKSRGKENFDDGNGKTAEAAAPKQIFKKILL